MRAARPEWEALGGEHGQFQRCALTEGEKRALTVRSRSSSACFGFFFRSHSKRRVIWRLIYSLFPFFSFFFLVKSGGRRKVYFFCCVPTLLIGKSSWSISFVAGQQRSTWSAKREIMKNGSCCLTVLHSILCFARISSLSWP